jgi:sphinganine-1-phosphate aldolase
MEAFFMSDARIRFPKKGQPKDEVMAELAASQMDDVQWREGKTFSLVYHAGEEVTDLLMAAYILFFSQNALNPTAFPSLRRFETEVVLMAADLLGGDKHVVGNMTSGGTESCLMAVKTARDWFLSQHPEVKKPEMILAISGHPAFDKAAHYFGVEAVRTPVREDFRADVGAIEKAIRPETALVVGSAPCYPHGVVDPITELGQLAQERKVLFHVDACVGGFMLPFVHRLGYPVPDFDFRVPGVTSISADLHKYGYAAKGASLILYRNREIRRHQLFATVDWPGGIYASPTMSGTRPAGPIAASWALMKYLGEEGYLKVVDTVMKTTTAIREGVEKMEGVKILGDPEMSLLALASDQFNIYEVGDEMTASGWYLDRQQYPPSLHLTINFAHAGMEDRFLEDLADAIVKVRKPSFERVRRNLMLNLAELAVRYLPEGLVSQLTSRASSMLGVKGASLPKRSAAMYGMMGSLPNRGDLKEVVLDLVEQFTMPQD